MINQSDTLCNALEKIEHIALKMYFHLMERVKLTDVDNDSDLWIAFEGNIAPYRNAVKAIQNCLKILTRIDTETPLLIRNLKHVEYFVHSRPLALSVGNDSENGMNWTTRYTHDLESCHKVITEYIQAFGDELNPH